MSYASRVGRARVSSTNPQALGVCQRCGIWANRVDLLAQWQWQGASLQNQYIYVCSRCMDTPQQQLRSIALPADPVPVMYPLVEPFLYDATEDQTVPYGAPVGLVPSAVLPMGINPVTGQYQAYGVSVAPLSVVSNGTTTVTVTCSAAHGLSTNGQVAVSGLSNALADGFFSVSVTSATAFTYTTAEAVAAGSLLTGTSRIVTVIVGLPRGSTTIYQVG